mmetsp:Transcript_33695/g.63461  ORF Transcript_33695/g.63461 Transcript_33695/m.63461 type:complete len:232 (+) Transcript_33695:674-1369(+)
MQPAARAPRQRPPPPPLLGPPGSSPPPRSTPLTRSRGSRRRCGSIFFNSALAGRVREVLRTTTTTRRTGDGARGSGPPCSCGLRTNLFLGEAAGTPRSSCLRCRRARDPTPRTPPSPDAPGRTRLGGRLWCCRDWCRRGARDPAPSPPGAGTTEQRESPPGRSSKPGPGGGDKGAQPPRARPVPPSCISRGPRTRTPASRCAGPPKASSLPCPRPTPRGREAARLPGPARE